MLKCLCTARADGEEETEELIKQDSKEEKEVERTLKVVIN